MVFLKLYRLNRTHPKVIQNTRVYGKWYKQWLKHACMSVWAMCPQMTTQPCCTALNHIRTLWAGTVAVVLLLKRFCHSCFQSLRYIMLNVLSGDKSFCLTRWTWVLKRVPRNHLGQQGKGSWNECNFPLNRVWLCVIIVLKNRLSNDILNWASKHTLTKRRHWQETYLLLKQYLSC